LDYSDKNEDSYQQVYENNNFDENKASLGHEVIAGGAAFAGFKAFEDHQRKEGKHFGFSNAISRTDTLLQASPCPTNSPKSFLPALQAPR
jgi:hypothetical protein